MSLHSARDRVTVACSSFERAVAAWRTASSDGTGRVVAVANGLVTLYEHATYLPDEAAPGELGRVHEAAHEALSWLKTTVARLERALNGLDMHVEGFRDALERDPVGTLNEYDTVTLPLEIWTRMFQDGVDSLRADLGDKQAIVCGLDDVVMGIAPVERVQLETFAEKWLEMPRVYEHCLDVVVAAQTADAEARRVVGMNASLQCEGFASPTPKARGGGASSGGSPALALLLKGSGKTKPSV